MNKTHLKCNERTKVTHNLYMIKKNPNTFVKKQRREGEADMLALKAAYR